MFGAALDGSGDWRTVAAANGVSVGTACGWIRRCEQLPKMRGSVRHKKVTDAEVEKLLSYLEEEKTTSFRLISMGSMNACAVVWVSLFLAGSC